MNQYTRDICAYAAARKEGDIVVDLRSEYQFSFGSLPGAVNIPVDSLDKLADLPQGHPVYVYCQKGERSESIAALLREMGYEAYHLEGGYQKYFANLAQSMENGV